MAHRDRVGSRMFVGSRTKTMPSVQSCEHVVGQELIYMVYDG
jgi:hypothetical protein